MGVQGALQPKTAVFGRADASAASVEHGKMSLDNGNASGSILTYSLRRDQPQAALSCRRPSLYFVWIITNEI